MVGLLFNDTVQLVNLLAKLLLLFVALEDSKYFLTLCLGGKGASATKSKRSFARRLTSWTVSVPC
jgi:hypothetical protein